MNAAEAVSEITKYELMLNKTLTSWLKKYLPYITKNWWDELVLPSLTPLQRSSLEGKPANDIAELDLAASLKVLLNNWFSLAGIVFLNKKYRHNAIEMQQVRNRWAHVSASDINQNTILADLEVIKNLLESFDCSPKELNELESFIMDVESNANSFTVEPTEMQAVALVQVQSDEISVGSMVKLKSDPSKQGYVTSIVGKKCMVFLGPEGMRSFYKEQLMNADVVETDKTISLEALQVMLTAYQINNPGNSKLYSLNAARIDFVPYQFRPALKMIKSDEQRILIADDVGVGKTIEAGLILKELEARSEIKSVLVICPRALVVDHKWRSEMLRFDEDFAELDSSMLRHVVVNYDGAWPERYSKAIISYSSFNDLLLNGNERFNGLTQLDPAPHFDLVIVDEAHHIRNKETLAYKGVETFVKHAGAVVFLTATPIQNSSDDLYTLLELLRNDIVNNKENYRMMAQPNRFINEMLSVVRKQEQGWQNRVKELYQKIMHTKYGYSVMQHNPRWDVINEAANKKQLTIEEKVELINNIEELHTFAGIINRTRRRDIGNFCQRRTITVDTDFDEAQQTLYDALMDFENKALHALHGNVNTRFMMCTIMRQASSCLYGLLPFVNDLIARRINEIDTDGGFDFGDDINFGVGLLKKLAEEIKTLVKELPEDDPKFNKLYNEIIIPKMNMENNKIIIFSSFKHSLYYIKNKLEAQGIRVGQIDGSVEDEDRRLISHRFKGKKEDIDTLDVLLFTEVGCEGLDYQFCDTLVNYDMPWNPMKIEQRIGRIDRRGQMSEAVKIYNMITSGTIDANIYERCLLKINIFENSIGDCAEILGQINKQITKIMYEQGLTEDERNKKLEKMAENDILKINEIRRLEADEKDLYGFDLSSYLMDKEVQNAESAWITGNNIIALVDAYLHEVLGDGAEKLPTSFFAGKGDIKTLMLRREHKNKLLEILRANEPFNNTKALVAWESYLKSPGRSLSVTFDFNVAREEPNVEFLNQLHPLVMLAAQYKSKEAEYEMAIKWVSNELPEGDYPFIIYNWTYKGEKNDIKLVPVCENRYIKKNLTDILQSGNNYQTDVSKYADSWDLLEELHYDEWSTAKDKFVEQIQADCKYRSEQKEQNLRAKKERRLAQYGHIGDVNIQNMNKGIFESIDNQIADIRSRFEKIANSADITFELLTKGIVHVVADVTMTSHS